MVEEELYDERFAREWTVGFDELCQLVQHFRPEVAEEITGVPAETVRELARQIASTRGACPSCTRGLEYSDSGVQAIRGVFTLFALAGQLDVPGGLLFRMKENVFPQNRSRLVANPDMKKALGRDRFPVYSAYRGESTPSILPEAVLEGKPYPIRALTVLGGSMITAWPDPELWRRTFAALDFMVSVNRYHTADSAYADIVLPATTYYENVSYHALRAALQDKGAAGGAPGGGAQRFLDPGRAGEAPGLRAPLPAERGRDAPLRPRRDRLHPGRGAADGGEARFPSVMMQYKKWEKGLLRPDGRPGFNTPSGKFEIASSDTGRTRLRPAAGLHGAGRGAAGEPGAGAAIPAGLQLRHPDHPRFRTQHHGVRGLSDRHPEPPVTINRQDAEELGISEGDRVWVETLRGGGRLLRAADRRHGARRHRCRHGRRRAAGFPGLAGVQCERADRSRALRPHLRLPGLTKRSFAAFGRPKGRGV